MSEQPEHVDEAAFANEQVPLASLPAHEQVALEPISSRYALRAALGQLVGWGVAAAAAWLLPIPEGVRFLGSPALPWLLLAIAALASSLAWLDGRRRAFALREHDLIYARGLAVRQTVIVPVVRIQHIESASGPIERALGLERLTCFTAGGLSADLVIRGLDQARAERVRDFVLRRIQAREKPQAAEPEPEPEPMRGEDG
jgi:uncharacterized protein